MKRKFLILGAIPIENKPKTYGGTTILMKSLIDFIKNHNVDYLFIQLNRYSGSLSLFRNYFYSIYCFLINIDSSALVMLNVSRNGAFFLSPMIYILAKLFSKKVVFRIFGGNFEYLYLNKFSSLRIIAKTTFLKSDLLIVETKQNIQFLKSIGFHKLFWLPNVRSKQNQVLLKRELSYRQKFVFIGHVKKTKGIFEIAKASTGLPQSFKIDIYGPIMDNLDINTVENSIIKYKGILSPDEIITTLAQYDVVLLPSYHDGEGHPGVLIEAMSIGLPAISTYWNAIPEVIEDGYNGFLVPIKNSKKLLKAMLRFNDENYRILSENAVKRFESFDDKVIYNRLLAQLNSL
ncbi:glycosyltransferase [Muricauda sp. SCSIO 64092]|uniref:glycosyltransferase n=1 Tax=Allomuricauda sp. SCSIO 64092 TaxID=2908842 RepID=UPI001FF3A50B|nr:glycosyltransferase [Muricauda sp. SCSIO 64092]UOY08829.1 glycosyltransferase [Muricauda sp. SCSIO 64092]